jgi:lantibiotic modifying enzyme
VVLCSDAAGDYGFVEFIEHRACSAARLAEFYRNAGRLLALLHVLAATDCHRENLITAGDQLVLIDAETLLCSASPAAALPGAGSENVDPIDAAWVLQVGMLPGWLWLDGRRQAVDLSALGVAGAAESGVLAEHLEALVTGFSSAYEVLAQGRSTWVQDVLATAESAHNRAVLRPTYVYASLLQSLLAPDALRSAAAQSLVLERLARAYVDTAGEPSWSLAAAEQEALSRLDVPYFTWAVTGGETRWGQGSLSGWPAHDQLADAQRRVERLGEEDLRRQVALIRASVHATACRMMPGPVSPPVPLIASPVPVPVHALARRSFTSTADAAFSVRGQATWMGLSLLPDGVHANIASIGSGLYDGRMGLAAGFRLWAHADPDSRDQALELRGRAVEPLMELLIDPHRVHRLGLGNGVGFAGVGGLLRGLAFLRSGEVVDGPERILDEQLEAVAGALVASLDPESLRDDARIDLMSGVAGVVTPLTRLLAGCATRLACSMRAKAIGPTFGPPQALRQGSPMRRSRRTRAS